MKQPGQNQINQLAQFEIDRLVKYAKGRSDAGRSLDGPFIGDPLDEAYEELCDFYNYILEHNNQTGVNVDHILSAVELLVLCLRGMSDEVLSLRNSGEADQYLPNRMLAPGS